MILITFFLIGELCHTSGFIDIPTVPQYDMPGMLGVGLTFSLPFYTENPNPDDSIVVPDPKDFTVTIHYGLGGRAELALSMYTPSTYALSASYLLKKEHGSAPAIFVGIDDISYKTHISTIGADEETGFLEEKGYYFGGGGRPPEIFSAYVAMQKSLGPYTNLVLGLGRGRFVGYGKRSHIFNTDFFVLGDDYTTEEHSSWAFGLFFGGSIRFPFGLELIAEIDGRDGNAGIKYHHKHFTTTLAITKAEQFWGDKPFSPRFTLGLEANNRFALERPKTGSLECVIRDATSQKLLPSSMVDIKEINRRTEAKSGVLIMDVPPGNYTVTVSNQKYKDYIAKVSVKPEVRTKLVFNLKKTEEALREEAALQEKEQNIRNYFEQGKIYFSEDNLDEATAAFTMVLSLNSEHQGAKDYLDKIEPRRAELVAKFTKEAKSRTKANDFTKAIESWQKVLELDAKNEEAKKAIADLREKVAAAKKPSKPTKPTKPKAPTKPKEPTATAEEIQALYKKGVSYFTAENYDAALKLFKQVLALDPKHAGAKDYKKRTEARIKILKGG